MAYRCRYCGQVYEGDDTPLHYSKECPSPSSPGGRHSWSHFQSALDKQNKLLKEQNLFLSKAYERQETNDTYQNDTYQTAKKMILIDTQKSPYYKKIYDYVVSETGLANYLIVEECLRQVKKVLEYDNSRGFGWLFYRDLDLKDRSRESLDWSRFQIAIRKLELAYSKAPSFSVFNYKNCKNKNSEHVGSYDSTLVVELIECFKKSKWYSEYDGNNALPFLDHIVNYYPIEYCKYLDENMQEFDGKKAYNEVLDELKKENRKERAIDGLSKIVLLSIVLVPILFILKACI